MSRWLSLHSVRGRLVFDGLFRFLDQRTHRVLIPLVALVLAVVWDRPTFWLDEAITARIISSRSAGELLYLSSFQPNLPTWYFVPKLLGLEAAVALSLLSFPVTIYAVGRTAESIYDVRTAGYAATLTALSPVLIEQAGWLRMYAPLTGLFALTLWLGVDGRYRGAGAVSVAASMVHPFGWLASVWLSITILRRTRWGSVGFAYGLLIFGLGSIPNLTYFAQRVLGAGASNTSQAIAVTHGRVLTIIDVGLLPVFSLAGGVLPLVAVPVVVLLSGLIIWKADRQLLLFIIIPLVAIGAMSWLVHPVYRLKYFSIIAPAVAVMAAAPRRPKYMRIAILISFLALYAISFTGRPESLCAVSIHADRCSWMLSELAREPSYLARRVFLF